MDATNDEDGLGKNSLAIILELPGLGFQFCELHWNHNGKNHMNGMFQE